MDERLAAVLRRNLRRALSEKRTDEARNILARLQAEDPLSRETRGFELELLLLAGRLEEAAKLARQLTDQFPDSGRILFLAGRVAYARRHYAEAEKLFLECDRVHPATLARYWRAKALSQLGSLDDAEALLLALKDSVPSALLDLSWISERRGDLRAALGACEAYLHRHPDDRFALEQQTRLKARMLDPESLIEEVSGMEELGEPVTDALFPELIRSLFETGQALRARSEIERRLPSMDPLACRKVAWVCYRAAAWDVACTLFLRNLEHALSDFKLLNALEAAARRCGRVQEVADAYAGLLDRSPQLHGRRRNLLKAQ